MMVFQSSKFLQLKPRNTINFQKFIFTVHRQTEKYVEMISTSHVDKLKHAVAQCLRCWIPNPEVPGSKPLRGSKVNSDFHPSEGNQFSTRNCWKPGNRIVKRKLSHRSCSVALKQLNLLHKKGPQGHRVKVFLYYNFVLQLMIFFYLYTHIRFSVSKRNFHFKGKGRISTDGFNKINLGILQFNILNFQIKQFIIFQKFSQNSVQPSGVEL